jgi:hypothetical protein
MSRRTSCCIHILLINDFFPELTEMTLKTVERYAKNINAKLNIISQRKFPDWPILTEKLQVYDYPDYDWNILMDADILVHPDTIDPLIKFDPREVGNKDEYQASNQLRPDKYFIRDGRNLGLSGCLICTSRLTHDLWEFPTDLTKKEVLGNILQDRKCVDEYVISRNLAKYGLKYRELFPVKYYNMMYHLGTEDEDKNKVLSMAKEWMKVNWK